MEIGIGHVSEAAIRIQVQRTVARTSEQSGDYMIAIDVAIVAEHARGGHSQKGVFVSFVLIINCCYIILDRSHGDGNSGDSAFQFAIAGFVGKGISAVPVQIRLVAEAAIGIEGQGAVGHIVHQADSERGPVDIVGQNARSGNIKRDVFFSRVCVVCCRRCDVIDDQGGAQLNQGIASQVFDRTGGNTKHK